MAYARFSMFDLGRYESLHEQKTGMNSHCPMLPIYRRMLNVFQTLKKPSQRLSLANIQAISDAGYPERVW